MQTRKLGNTDMDITALGFGTWAIGGGGWAYGWGPQDDKASIAAINRALDLGMNWIDTAPVYGFGRSETVVGQAIKGRSQQLYIFTKCTRRWDDKGQIYGNLKADSIRREVDESLRRLKVDVIDLYQIHWPDPAADIEEAWTAMAELREAERVRFLGVSNFSVEQMRRAHAIVPISSLQPPYSLTRPEIEQEILPFCAENNIGVIAYSPMANGLLSGTMTRERIAALPDDDWRKTKNKDFQEPNLTHNLKLVELLRDIGKRHGRSPGEVAIAWTLRHPAVTGAIVGGRRADQVDGIIGAGDFRLSEDEIAEIAEFQQARG